MPRLIECHRTDCKHVNSRRTSSQNNALHKFFELVAEALNGAGWTIRKTLAHYKVDIEWSPASIKNDMWRPIQIAVLGKHSTTDLKKQGDIDKVYEHVNRFLSNEPFGIHVPFPNNPDKEESKSYLEAEEIEYPLEEFKEPLI